MKVEEIRLEMEVLSLLFFATCDQMNMVKGFLKHEPKKKFNLWQSHGEAMLKTLDLGRNEEYMLLLTDTLHLQMDEVRRAITTMKERAEKERIENEKKM